MNKSYLLQGFKATAKTYKAKKSSMFTFIFLTIASFFGKFLFITGPLFRMFDMNIAKNAALHNEVNMAEGFRGADSLSGNVKMFVLSFLKGLLLVSLIIVLAIATAILMLVAAGLTELSEFGSIHLMIVAPIIIIAIVLSVVIVSLFVPSTYVTLYSKDKSLFNILHCCKASLKASTVFKVVLYNVIYALLMLIIPMVLVVILTFTEFNILYAVIFIGLLIAQIYVFGYVKLARDIAIYLLFRSNVKLEPKKERRDTLDLPEEEKLTDLFTNN